MLTVSMGPHKSGSLPMEGSPSSTSQKTSQLEIIQTNFGRDGFSRPKRRGLVDIKAQDPFGFTPFQKTTPDGRELWLSHKLADSVSAWSVGAEPKTLDSVSLGKLARPESHRICGKCQG